MGSLIHHLGQQGLFRVIRSLSLSDRPRHLRDLATTNHMSPAGVSDILARLKSWGVLNESKSKNKKLYSLVLKENEKRLLKNFFDIYEEQSLRSRAVQISDGAAEKLAWMNDAHLFYQSIKDNSTKGAK